MLIKQKLQREGVGCPIHLKEATKVRNKEKKDQNNRLEGGLFCKVLRQQKDFFYRCKDRIVIE